MLMKVLLISLAIFALQGGGKRIARLVQTTRSLRASFRSGAAKWEDPASFARDVTPRAPLG